VKHLFFLSLICWSACTLPEEKAVSVPAKDSVLAIQSADSHAANAADVPDVVIKPQPSVKLPSGIYQTKFPLLKSTVEQTIVFNADRTFRLQEQTGKDSIVVTSGNWAPSDGFIWLYRDQVVRGRYSWKGDSLYYYSPQQEKSYPLKSLTDIGGNPGWRNRQSSGSRVFGIGNEPFWSIELGKKDSLAFQLADWDQPKKFRVDSMIMSADSTVYYHHQDSVQLTLTVFPYFCSDGMSDYTYPNRISVRYNNQQFSGCGVAFGK
jgi:hypothetical protein